MADVFISYKRTERDRVNRVAELLRGEGLDVWFDAKLSVGSNEGFDAEVEREVTSASCVLACWTKEAVKSVWVRAEAMKGLERDVLRPVFLELCDLPVPFNAVDAADLSKWDGAPDSPDWRNLVASVKARVKKSRSDQAQKIELSRLAYERIEDQIYPGTLALLAQRIAAIHDTDADKYQADIIALLNWLESIAEKEARHAEYGYELQERQSGGDAWRWWDSGGAAARSADISRIRDLLGKVDSAFARAQGFYSLPPF